MKFIYQPIRIFFVWIVVFVFLLELSSRLFLVDLFSQSLGLIEKHSHHFAINHLPIDSLLKREDWPAKLPHPYFGYINANKFENVKNFRLKDPSQKYIGVFGGSVAQQISGFSREQENYFSKNLSHLLGNEEDFSNEIDFSAGGGRQPRQNNIAALYGSSIELAINIEGANEMMIQLGPSSPPYFPMQPISNLYFSGLEPLKSVSILVKLLGLRFRAAQRIEKDSYIFEFKKLFDYVLYKVSLEGLARFEKNLEPKGVSDFYNGSSVKNESAYDPVKKFQFWLKLSCLQQNIFFAEGKHNFVFVQPLPYYLKPLSQEEKQYPILWGNEKKNQTVANFFEKIDFKQLRRSGLQIHSLLTMFEHTTETVFTDMCCHVNHRGKKMISEKIIDVISENWAPQPKFCDLVQLKQIIEKQMSSRPTSTNP